MRLSRPLVFVFFLLAFAFVPPQGARAEVSCYRFAVQADAQSVLAALPNDPYGLDQGRVTIQDGEVDDQDAQAGNGAPCDRFPAGASAPDSPETGASATGGSLVRRKHLPAHTVQATVIQADRVNSIQVELPDGSAKTVAIIGIVSPETEGDQAPPQCFADETIARLQQLLPPGKTVFLETDPHAATGTTLHRHIWLKNQKDGTYRLLSEWLVSGGYAIVSTDRLGTGLPRNPAKPLYDSRYRDELRKEQQTAISKRLGLWGACGGAASAPVPTPTDVPVAFTSGGLGLSQAEWESVHGQGTPEVGTLVEYNLFSDGEYQFEVSFTAGNADTIGDYPLDGGTMTLDEARAESQKYMPSDSGLVEIYVDRGGLTVDLYSSESLKSRFTDTGGALGDPWINGQPGQFIVAYSPAVDPGLYLGFVLGIGNNP